VTSPTRSRTIDDITKDRGNGLTTVGTWPRSERARHFARFLAVGVGNTVLSFIVSRALLTLGTWYVLAAPVAIAAGAVNGYVSDRGWTFGALDSTPARMFYALVQVTGALSTSLLVPLFIAAGLGKLSA